MRGGGQWGGGQWGGGQWGGQWGGGGQLGKIITYGPSPARFVHCDGEPNIFLSGLTKLSQEAFYSTSTNC